VFRAVTAVATGVLVALTIAGTGHADPSPSDFEAQIDTQWNQLEPAIEAHDKVQSELNDNRAKSNVLATQLAPLQTKVDLAMTEVTNISTRYYRGGKVSELNSLLDNGSPLAMVDQLTLIDHMARNQLSAIKDVIALKNQYEAQKKPLDALLAEETKQEADLANQEKSINAEIARLNDLRLKAYGTTMSTGKPQLAACPYDYTPDPGGRAAKIACQQLGKPYIFGAEGPTTFDCSGLTMYAWAHANAGVNLRHYTQWQYDDTQRITKDQLRVGDLIFYYADRHHIGIYVGGGWVVHAPHTGDVVRMKRFDEGPISGYGRPVTH
jgi:peptidoglycan DL-endopeptidase CwlO